METTIQQNGTELIVEKTIQQNGTELIMEKTIQQNGKEDQPLPIHPHGWMENKDQLKNTVEIMGEPKMSQQSAIFTSGGTPSSTWKAANSLQATTNNLKDLITTDEVVRQSLINDNWRIVESRKSRMVSTLPKYSVRSLVPPYLTHNDRISERLLSTTTSTIISTTSAGQGQGQAHAYQEQNVGQHNGNHLSRSTRANFNYNERYGVEDFQGNANKVRSTSMEAESLQAKGSQNYRFGGTETKKNGRMSFNNSLDDDEDDDEDDDLFSITMRKKRNVPLPAFGDDDDVDGEENSADEEVPYASQWSMKDKGSLSFYDNMMDLDIKKPLYMLVPHSLENSSPRIGELELDQLSDLSENDAKSDEIPLSDTDEDFSRRSNHRKLSSKDFSMQTDEPFPALRMKEAGTMTAADIIAEIEADRSGNLRGRSFIPLPTKSTEGDETDPKFTKRPATFFEVLEGEEISITCQLNGSAPIDVFWFRDMEEVTQLEEDNRCDISHVGDFFTMTLFDTTEKDGGQYLCIGVNAQGHCVQGFQVNVKENKNQRISPSFLAGLENIEAFKGFKATFGCKVAGYPPPRILWYHKGERCRDGMKYQIANDGNGGHKLVIRDVGETDTSYSAVARNVNGEVSSTAEVNVKENYVEHSKTVSLSSVTSPYPDVNELMQIAERVSSTASEITPSRTTSRTFSFTVDKTFDENTLKRERDKLHSDTNFKDVASQFKVCRESDEVFLPLPAKNNKDLSDDEQELNVSYQEFERLFEARLISRSQLHSGRVWKRDLEKIQAFLKKEQISTDNKKPHETETNDDVQLRVNCGLKSVNPSFYRRDYVVSMDSARHNRSSESHHQENQQMAGGILRSSSVTTNSTEKSVKVMPTGLDSVSFQNQNNDLSRNQIMNATKEHSVVGVRTSESVDTNSEDHDVDEKFVMPCVRELLSKFNAPMSPETPVDEVSPLKRIYSLTGRSVPEFVRERIQRQMSSSSTAGKEDKGYNKNTSENYNRYSLPAQHATYIDGAPINAVSTNIHGHVTTETVTNRQVSDHSASPSIKHDNVNINVRELRFGQLQGSLMPSGGISRWVENPVSDSQQSQQRENDVVRRQAVYWQKYITEQQKPENFPKMPNGSFTSDDD